MVGLDDEGGSASPDIVGLAIGLRMVPLVPQAMVFRIGAPTADVRDATGQKPMDRNILGHGGHIELLAGHIVDAGPHPAVFTGLPSVWWVIRQLQARVLSIIVELLLIRVHFLAASLVRPHQVGVVRDTSIANHLESVLRRVKGVRRCRRGVGYRPDRLHMFGRSPQKTGTMPIQ